MATGSFYAHFGSKAEIFAAVVRQLNADLRTAMKQAIEQAGPGQREIERASFRAFFDMLSERPWMDRIVRESEFVAPGLFREYYEHLVRGYARGVRQAQLSGEVDARYDPEVIAFMYTGIGNFVGMRWADWTSRRAGTRRRPGRSPGGAAPGPAARPAPALATMAGVGARPAWAPCWSRASSGLPPIILSMGRPRTGRSAAPAPRP